ncbi:hypothetical protein AX15_007823 [Amanita polypyramis BW_CC]|nr:hypothetical protein AX15_007823 [Amanita polypyramis BW_CC]
MESKVLSAFLAIIFAHYASSAWKTLINNWKLRSIPSVGSNGLLTSFIGALRYFNHAKDIAQEGYEKYRGAFFKVSTMTQWMVVVSGPQYIDEIRRAPEEHLSFHEGLIDLTKNIGTKFSDVQDEFAKAFEEFIPTNLGDEWIKINVYSTIMDIVCRTSNRMFVGLPLCRDPDYMSLNKEFTINIIKAAHVINKFPSFLRSIVARLFANVSSDVKRGMRHLEPLIKERLAKEAQYGKDWPGKPNDLISWLLEAAQGEQRSIRNITIRMLLVNLAAIHTATMTFTYMLYDLATHPEFVQPMREEVESALQEEGWTHTAINKLSKLDSFVKESMRLSGIDAYGLKRKVMKDFTFSDGTMIPAGNLIAVAMRPIHLDSEYYKDPTTFDAFRFEKMRKEEGENTKHKFVSLDLNYLLFGHGRQACVGRFFAANELKTMLAHVLLNYDIKMADGRGRPSNLWIGGEVMPDPTANVLFRKRVQVQ